MGQVSSVLSYCLWRLRHNTVKLSQAASEQNTTSPKVERSMRLSWNGTGWLPPADEEQGSHWISQIASHEQREPITAWAADIGATFRTPCPATASRSSLPDAHETTLISWTGMISRSLFYDQ